MVGRGKDRHENPYEGRHETSGYFGPYFDSNELTTARPCVLRRRFRAVRRLPELRNSAPLSGGRIVITLRRPPGRATPRQWSLQLQVQCR